ncbi:hypothetical protein IFM89_030688 [Coptis chinensis]|uniref:ZF-HD dimerization-type domain-containing protein n=1 Tax=Coptis chinensis TaxID=261450 RepID=A0A835I7X7_9MAGN|nr:hypothetical protein IFM89_030688 [Coptis chinensis]
MGRGRIVKFYFECQKNHAAQLGTLYKDGCNEFLADETKPGGRYCEVCGCHRNYHRKFSMLREVYDTMETQMPPQPQPQPQLNSMPLEMQVVEQTRPRKENTKIY